MPRVHYRVAIWDPLPIYRMGIRAALGQTKLSMEEPSDLMRWVSEHTHLIVLLTLDAADDWGILKRLLQANEHVLIITLLSDNNLHSYARAVRTGAISAVARHASADDIRAVVLEAIKGRSLLPIEVTRLLTTSAGLLELPDQLEQRDIEWLRTLAQGASVAQLAESAGYSERAMYRLLRDVYARLGARNRTEAVAMASRNGWL
jgi:DNA-binding NarL/FixJ family response regulator